jgi:hypothetical protein
MTHPGPRVARAARASAIAVAIAGATCAFEPHVAQADPLAPQSAAECRAISDFTQRGLCWDALDRAGLHNDQVVKKRDFGLGVRPPAAAAVTAAKPEKKHDGKRSNPETAEVRGLTLTIASVGDTPQGRVLLTATDGAVWEQTDGGPVTDRPSPGDTFQVSKGAMGGYMCHVTRWQLVRCQRDK